MINNNLKPSIQPVDEKYLYTITGGAKCWCVTERLSPTGNMFVVEGGDLKLTNGKGEYYRMTIAWSGMSDRPGCVEKCCNDIGAGLWAWGAEPQRATC